MQRYDYKTDQISLVNVWPEESTGMAPKDLKYRFAWTFPIVISPHDPNVLYAGGNVVFKTTNEGQSWEPISLPPVPAHAASPMPGAPPAPQVHEGVP